MRHDLIDEKIIGMLRTNSRTSNVEISKSVGLTEGAVRHRIETLVKGGAISRFTIETGSASGTSYFGVVMLKAKHETKKMMAEIAHAKISRESYEISGEYDGCIILEGASLTEVDSKIDRLRKLRDVADTKTFIVLRKW